MTEQSKNTESRAGWRIERKWLGWCGEGQRCKEEGSDWRSSGNATSWHSLPFPPPPICSLGLLRGWMGGERKQEDCREEIHHHNLQHLNQTTFCDFLSKCYDNSPFKLRLSGPECSRGTVIVTAMLIKREYTVVMGYAIPCCSTC